MAKTIAQRKGARKAARRRGEEKKPAVPHPVPDLGSVKTQFNQAIAFVILCQRSLVNADHGVHEEQVLCAAIDLMQRVYEEIDIFEFNMSREGEHG